MQSCSLTAADEPLAGTAPVTHTWLIVEQPGPWTSHAPQAIPEFAELKGSGITPLFARRPNARRHGHHFWIARAGLLHQGSGASVAQLVAKARDPELEHTGDDEPAMFVCTNGARDACCATIGRALAVALDDPAVWECTHLGGHRFAPTALLLPSGNVYGRFSLDQAREALAQERLGETQRATLRGNSFLDRRSQAEQVLGTDDLVELPLAPRPESCGKPAVGGTYFARSNNTSR